MKIGVIMDGLSRDPELAFKVMNKVGLKYAELQYVWEKEIGDHTPEELRRLKMLTDNYEITISCITKHNFSGINVMDTDVNSSIYKDHIEKLKRSIEVAHMFGTKNVRVMVCTKQVIIWGENGAQEWICNNSAWDRFLNLYREPLRIAEENDIDLLAETSNNGMLTSGYLHKKFVDDLGSNRMKTLWDPANSINGSDIPFPNGYDMVKDSLAEIHIKDLISDKIKSTCTFCELGKGDMAPYLSKIAQVLKRDKFDGIINLESVYRPQNGTFEDGFNASLPYFKKLFGDTK